ncbi:MAG: hypothetical protein P9L89_01680 [Candidatus Celaenobacter polaris]|nr:hypothetical protein [Candidatus Celaenobacter polaris]
MNWPIKEYPIASLYLDQYNIRTPISDEDQNALIRDMFTNEDAFQTVRSYVQNNVFPDEFPIGIIEKGKNIIIEGNRLLAALKALNEPDIIPAWSKKIKALQNPNISKIRVVLAPDRAAANRHIANKHTVDYRRQWKPLRQAYFYKSEIENGKSVEEIITEFPEHNVPRFIKMLEMHHLAKSIDVDDSLKLEIHDDRNFPITNLERFYDDKAVSKYLGIDFDPQGRVRGKIDKKEFQKGFKKIIEDVATGEIDSRKFNKVEEREAYLERMPDTCKPDLSKSGSFGSPDFKELDVPKKKKVTDRKVSRRLPKGLFLQGDMPFNLVSTSLRIVYNELKDIDVARFPNATHDLLRSFLECVLVFYLKEVGEYGLVKTKHGDPTLNDMLTFIGSDKCKSISDGNIKQVISQIKSNYSQSYSLLRMNMINHNENWNSIEKEVRGAWGKIEGLFKLLLNPQK